MNRTHSLLPRALVALLPHFLRESVRAGIDVARRAFATGPASGGEISDDLLSRLGSLSTQALVDGLWVMPAGQSNPDMSSLSMSPQAAQLLQSLRQCSCNRCTNAATAIAALTPLPQSLRQHHHHNQCNNQCCCHNHCDNQHCCHKIGRAHV